MEGVGDVSVCNVLRGHVASGDGDLFGRLKFIISVFWLPHRTGVTAVRLTCHRFERLVVSV